MKPIEAEGLHTFYGKSHILHGVGLEVNEGEIVTLLGRNGAGKTTTLRSIMGLTPPREGSVKIFGQEASRMPTFEIAGLGIGYVPEGRKIFANLTVEENLKVPMARSGSWTIERAFQTFPRLAQRRTNKGRQLSGGEQEMLSIARALVLQRPDRLPRQCQGTRRRRSARPGARGGQRREMVTRGPTLRL